MTNTVWLAIVLSVAVVTGVILLVSYAVHQHRRRQFAAADRFRRDPQLGDRASYVVFVTAARRRWMVGEVTNIRRDHIGIEVELTVPVVTAIGSDSSRQWWSIDHLQYEPADTELGVHEASV